MRIFAEDTEIYKRKLISKDMGCRCIPYSLGLPAILGFLIILRILAIFGFLSSIRFLCHRSPYFVPPLSPYSVLLPILRFPFFLRILRSPSPPSPLFSPHSPFCMLSPVLFLQLSFSSVLIGKQ